MLSFSRYTNWVCRNARLIVTLGVLAGAWGTYYSVRLYQNLKPEFEELLPDQARSVQDLRRVSNRLAATQNLGVLVFSDHPIESKKFVTDLAKQIESDIPELVERIEYRIDAEMQFYKERQGLLLDLADLKRIRNYIRAKIEFETEIRNPLSIVSGVDLRLPQLDMDGLSQKYHQRNSDFSRFPDGFFATPDGKVRSLLVYLKGQALGNEKADALRKGVDEAIKQLNPSRYSPDIRIGFTGDVENLIEERASLFRDLTSSTVIVSFLVMVSLLIFYRTFFGTAALIFSLFTGALITFGISFFTEGYLNANSAFLGSIIIGNGINFGILFLARYLDGRRRGESHLVSTEQAIRVTSTGTLTAALAAGLAYGSLAFTQFRGFKQFGSIGFTGMVLCWICSLTLLPALMTLLSQRFLIRSKQPLQAPSHRVSSLLSGFIGKFPKLILGVTAVLGAGSIVVLTTIRYPLLETDSSNLRDRRSMEEGSGHLSLYLDQIFGRYISPVVIMASTHQNAAKIAEGMKALKKEQGGTSLISQVYSVKDFIPEDQPQKIAVLKEIRRLLRPEILGQMGEKERNAVKKLLSPQAFKSFQVKDLPGVVKDRFKEKDGSIGKVVLVEPVHKGDLLQQVENQVRFIDDLRKVTDSIEPGAAVVGHLPITVDLFHSIREDGPRVTAVAFLAVLLVVVLLFRNLHAVLSCVFSLILGVLWLAAVAFLMRLKINFLNFIALPITFGIGVDYGVNIYQRYRVEGKGSILKVIRETGGAVTLASLTTIIGYSSLLTAGNRGFVSFGKLAVVGEVTCLAAALLGLPSYLLVSELRKKGVLLEKKPSLVKEETEHEQKDFKKAA